MPDIGYRPKRGDFDHEYDEDVDKLLEDIEFQFYSDDNEEDLKFKYDIINLYNSRLDERIKRKNFVIERGILDEKKTYKYMNEKKKTQMEKDIFNALKIFARFNSH